MAQITSNSGAKVTDLGTFHRLYQSEGLRKVSVKVARGFFTDNGDVDLIATDAFIRVSQRISSGKSVIDVKKLSGFISRTTLRLCIDRLRSSNRRQNLLSLNNETAYGRKTGTGQTHIDRICDVTDWSSQVVSNIIANNCISKLPETYRELSRDVFIDGVSYADAAVMHNLPVTTVRSRIHRSRKMLREILEAEPGFC